MVLEGIAGLLVAWGVVEAVYRVGVRDGRRQVPLPPVSSVAASADWRVWLRRMWQTADGRAFMKALTRGSS